ncbi:hypothetical protein JHK82_034395 [Glycine max]|nr:hypothetical protein JHK85_035105 [Glycine max]KAG4986775.1 hypothetical protein JHK86_034466 [Glycine max]KAG5119975.1 hypothetical protein JHK82_034395 [Glycine max]KAG5140961.1 hypothetical protein JHK84_034729 [Glycine max]
MKVQVSSQDEDKEGEKVEKIIKTISCGMKKKVRLKTEDGEGSHHGDSASGPVRIRLVVTKEELKRMLRNRNENDPQHTSLEQLLSDMVLRDKRVFEVEKYGGSVNSWRPGLESIPEDCSTK